MVRKYLIFYEIMTDMQLHLIGGLTIDDYNRHQVTNHQMVSVNSITIKIVR